MLEVFMESKERRIDFPECKELMPALLLNDLNKCDNCGCPAYLFDRDQILFGGQDNTCFYFGAREFLLKIALSFSAVIRG
jgi:hypothetical protein